MWGLIRFLYKRQSVLIFILLEAVAFFLILNSNDFQRSRFLNSANYISGTIYKNYSAVLNYFRLVSINNDLVGENAKLRQNLLNQSQAVYRAELAGFAANSSEYMIRPAKVIRNSVNKQHNYITFNKGEKDGVQIDMGVFTSDGVVGVINHVSESYSTAISVLNLQWNISAKLKRNKYFGSLSWDGQDYQFAQLNEIPFHVEIEIGDTVVTSGYSFIFPEGLMLGIVEGFGKEGGDNFYSIHVKLSVDFKSLSYVEILENKKRPEIESLQKMNNDGKNMD
ncbi:MAG: rod shape-determining protein MreC [Prolixibacteraceae bacterium]|nr:rod shape-determining protein MreC [Prolixibacteraceae bacterium]